MPKILIKKILNKEKISKAGKPYKSCSILTTDKTGKEIWLNSFANTTTESWTAGQEVDLEIEKTEYGYKFKEPAERNLYVELDKINAKLDILLAGKQVKSDTQLANDFGANPDPHESEINPENIPFKEKANISQKDFRTAPRTTSSDIYSCFDPPKLLGATSH